MSTRNARLRSVPGRRYINVQMHYTEERIVIGNETDILHFYLIINLTLGTVLIRPLPAGTEIQKREIDNTHLPDVAVRYESFPGPIR